MSCSTTFNVVAPVDLVTAHINSATDIKVLLEPSTSDTNSTSEEMSQGNDLFG